MDLWGKVEYKYSENVSDAETNAAECTEAHARFLSLRSSDHALRNASSGDVDINEMLGFWYLVLRQYISISQ